MKSKVLLCSIALVLVALLALPIAAQQDRYTVTDLGTLGGTFSLGGGINNRGDVEGYSTLAGDQILHAVLWHDGVIADLGTLGGPNSFAFFRPSVKRQVGGASETSTPDPLGEDFCFFGSHLTCLPFVWQNGVMTALPTLGGNNGQADGFNSRGQVVGLAENTTHDPTCVAPQVLQFKPVMWTDGAIEELPTFPGDPDGQANAINDRGQAVGHSGNCDVPFQVHALLWQNGTATDLGNLGVSRRNTAIDINNQGQVVGAMGVPPAPRTHAFLWDNGVLTDLGTLPGDVSSVPSGINSKGQVVGGSCDADFNCRAFLWQNGVMTDLNTLIPADSPLFLIEATGTINARGQIAGYAFDNNSGEIHAFLLTPAEGDSGTESATSAAVAASGVRQAAILPENIRAMVRERLSLDRLRTKIMKR